MQQQPSESSRNYDVTQNPDIRFRFNEEGKTRIERVKDFNEHMCEKYPWFIGVSIYGSTTKGNTKETSDLDYNVFVDSTKLNDVPVIEDPEKLKILNLAVIWNIDPVEITKNTKLHYLLHTITSEAHEFNMQAPILVNLSREILEKLILAEVQALIGKKANFENPLIRCFMLAPKSKLYGIRKFILDTLENIDDSHPGVSGDKLFQQLMLQLKYHERAHDRGIGAEPFRMINKSLRMADPTKRIHFPEVPYAHYPQTIEEARKYFLTSEF